MNAAVRLSFDHTHIIPMCMCDGNPGPARPADLDDEAAGFLTTEAEARHRDCPSN
jgi:hypothetical protein